MFHLPLLPIGTYLYLFAMHFINVSSFAYFIYTSFLSLNLRTSFFSNYIYFISIHLYVILLSLDLCIFFSISQSIIILILLPLLSMFLYWYLFMLFSMSHSLYVILVSLYYSLTVHISLTLYVPLLVGIFMLLSTSHSLYLSRDRNQKKKKIVFEWSERQIVFPVPISGSFSAPQILRRKLSELLPQLSRPKTI